MKKILLSLVALVAVITVGCDNYVAKHWGGNMTVNVPAGQKLTGVTWEGTELWYLTRPMRSNEVAETSVLHEKSTMGVVQGSITFVEAK